MPLTISSIPRVRLYGYGAVALVIISYLAWSLWGHRPQQPAAGFVAAAPAVKADKVPGPTVALRVIPKTAVRKQFPGAAVAADEEVIESSKIDPAPNGAVAITSINTTTGEARTDVQMNQPAWLALERTNYIGIGYDLSTDGSQRARLYYKRDLVRSRDVHLQGAVQVTVPVNGGSGTAEGIISGNIEYRF
jgi:hypothetical protein